MNLFIKEKELEKIVLEYLLSIRQLEDLANRTILNQLENLNARVLLNLHQNLKNKDNSKLYEKIFYQFQSLVEGFGRYQSLCESLLPLIGHEKIRKIFLELNVDGERMLIDAKGEEENPIAYERMVIISAGVLKIKQYYRKYLETAYEALTVGNDPDEGQLLTMMSSHIMAFYNNTYEDVLSIISDTTRTLSLKNEALKYLRRMEEQESLIGSITQMPLETWVKKLESEDAIQAVTTLYNHLAEMEKIFIKLRDYKQPIDLMPVENLLPMSFIEEIVENHMFSHNSELQDVMTLLRESKDAALSALKDIGNMEMDYLLAATTLQVKQAAGPIQLLSCQIQEVFSKMVGVLKVLSLSNLSSEGHGIAEGIISSLTMKYESLKEKDTVYQIGKKDLQVQEEHRLRDMKATFSNEADHMLKEAIDGSYEPFVKVQQQFYYQVDQVLNKHMKFDVNYLKQDILFEIRTYEELLNHSVKKLIEIEKGEAKSLTEEVADGLQKIRDILFNHQLEFIKPQTHDKFDGKLHEVMTVQASQDFVKGEIIKTMNMGYRYKGQILLRASVIVAK